MTYCMTFVFTKCTNHTLHYLIPTVREVTAHGDSGEKSFKSAISLIELAGWLAGWLTGRRTKPTSHVSVLTFHLITYQAPRREREIKRQQPSERVRGGVRGRRGGVVLADQALEIAAPANAITRKNAEAPSLPSQQMITLGNQCRRPNISSRPPTLCSVLRVA